MKNMHHIPLKPIRSTEWEEEYNLLMQDTWLRKKLKRESRLKEHYDYIDQYLPEIRTMERGLVIDLGPGCGELLEIARMYKHDILGVDAKTGAGGMGDSYLRVSQLMTQRQKIPVEYVGFREWVEQEFRNLTSSVVVINSRGSIEQMYHSHMEGESHDRHQCCHRLAWKITGALDDELARMFRVFWMLLRPGGVVRIHANGARNTEAYNKMVLECSKASGLKLIANESNRLHKWVKPLS